MLSIISSVITGVAPTVSDKFIVLNGFGNVVVGVDETCDLDAQV